MVSQTRESTCLTLVSRRDVPSWPRKYLETTTLVAICDQDAGISQSFCSKTTSPFSLEMTAARFSHCTSSKGCTPGVVKRRSTTSPRPSCTSPRAAGGAERLRRATVRAGWESSGAGTEDGTGLSTTGPRWLGDHRCWHQQGRTGFPQVTHRRIPSLPTSSGGEAGEPLYV